MVVGLFYGLLYTRFGVPSFVITLAGLLGFLGLQLWVLGKEGTINLPFTSGAGQFAPQRFLSPGVAVVLALPAPILGRGASALGARAEHISVGVRARRVAPQRGDRVEDRGQQSERHCDPEGQELLLTRTTTRRR